MKNQEFSFVIYQNNAEGDNKVESTGGLKTSPHLLTAHFPNSCKKAREGSLILNKIFLAKRQGRGL